MKEPTVEQVYDMVRQILGERDANTSLHHSLAQTRLIMAAYYRVRGEINPQQGKGD